MWNRTKVSELLEVDYPIIQGPFGGRFSTAKLISTVSNLGGMGSFGLNAYQPDEIIKVNDEIKKRTAKPYALNLWVPLKNDPIKSFTPTDFEAVQRPFLPLFEKENLEPPKEISTTAPDYDEQLAAVIKSRPPVASFIFGLPEAEVIKELKKGGSKIIGTATTVEEAEFIEAGGADLVVATGNAAGGHRAAFLEPNAKSFLETNKLLPKVIEKVSIPVIAAGGITTSNDIKKMFALGASGVQLGTVFLATGESGAPQHHKKRLFSETGYTTTLTKVFTGRYGRVIQSKFVDDHIKTEVAPYPLQSSFLAHLRKKYLERGDMDLMAYWAGQPTSKLKFTKASELFSSLVRDLDD
ncbi:NAD(P)H-dependent flavin oxidoreductase [Flagellimonas flava]|uniref:Propionate 3-nitronate monooxygenase n=1 Tax=Flagellimonas flava TaxID=570519 RepID=A0A1M5KUX7_9FLAO|nr:nitronate monooxygenase [Allomuricauda flava]SHG56329.1 nitronate monooxygenase [Allomuricauda flava]